MPFFDTFASVALFTNKGEKMKLGSAWLDRYEAIRDAEKKWQQSVAEFRATVPPHLIPLVDELFSESGRFEPVSEVCTVFDTDQEMIDIFDNFDNPNWLKMTLAGLAELKEHWKGEKELSFEPVDTHIEVTIKTIFPPMRFLKMKLEQDYFDAVCEWILIPTLHDEMWSFRFTHDTLELVITYDICRTPNNSFCVSYGNGDDKSYFATQSDVQKNVDSRVNSYIKF